MVDVGAPTLAEAVRAARASAGLTQEELAERAESSVRAVRNLESGRVTRPHSATLDRIAGALGLDAGGLLDLSRGRSGRPGPAQLPPDAPDLVPRDGVERLLGVLADPAAAAPPVVVVTGPPGMGKTTLAVHLGHRLRDAFPDGQLYVELGRVPPAPALEGMLDALGVTGPQLPADLAGRAAVFRSRVAGRRLLVVLDDAADADQVRHLLPGTPGCAVVVTSRRTMAGLPASAYVDLPGLSASEARTLLRGVAGAERIDAEPAAAADLVAACGGLPLALRITGARLAARPAWQVRDLADRMTARSDRLAELSTGDLRIRDTFAASYRLLDAPERRTFRLLGVLDHPEVGTAVAAALTDRPEGATRAALDRLADLHLVVSPRPGRWRLHDLLHAFAAELTRQQDPPPVRAAALGRAVERLAAGAAAARAVLRPVDVLAPPGPPRPRAGELPDAMAWFATEWAGLVRLVGQAAADHPDSAFRLLADGLEYLYVRGAWRRTSGWARSCSRWPAAPTARSWRRPRTCCWPAATSRAAGWTGRPGTTSWRWPGSAARRPARPPCSTAWPSGCASTAAPTRGSPSRRSPSPRGRRSATPPGSPRRSTRSACACAASAGTPRRTPR